MRRHTIRAKCLVACAVAWSIGSAAVGQSRLPGELDRSTREVDTSSNHPVEPKVADRGDLTMPGRSMPYELALPQGFDRVFAVPGKAGMFYRGNGGLYIVFEEGEYARGQKGKEYAMVPAGACYYIGKPDWSTIVRRSDLAAGSIQSQQEIRDESQAKANATTIDRQRNDEVQPLSAADESHRDRIVRSPTGSEPPLVVGNEAGFGAGTARGDLATDTIEVPKPAEFESKSPDVAAWAGTLPQGVDRSFLVGDGSEARPRFTVDFFYRQERLSRLFQRAKNSVQ